MKHAKPDEKSAGAIAGAVAEFNKYRSPEATARLVFSRGAKFEVDFSGHFCRTCGFYDYFDDFLIMLQEAGVVAKRSRVNERDDGALVEFRLA